MTSAKKLSYHHGNLRQALLDTAMEHLQSQGLESLSLRGLAKSLGVTPTAVYSHFTDKVALMVDLNTIGFNHLNDFLEDSIADLKTASPETKLRALAHAYLEFAANNPHLFDILFNWTPEFDRLTPDCIEAGTKSECLLHASMQEVLLEYCKAPTEYQVALASFSAWSLAHGIAMLTRSGSIEASVYTGNWPDNFSASRPDSRKQAINYLVSIQLAGLKQVIPTVIER